jgi:hypothetical protein
MADESVFTTIKEVVIKEIQNRDGAQGLCNEEFGCGCHVANLMPCGHPDLGCELACVFLLNTSEELFFPVDTTGCREWSSRRATHPHHPQSPPSEPEDP